MLTIYSKPNCQACSATKRMAERRGVGYREVMLTDELATRFKSEGLMMAPIVENLEGERWAGYRPDRIK